MGGGGEGGKRKYLRGVVWSDHWMSWLSSCTQFNFDSKISWMAFEKPRSFFQVLTWLFFFWVLRFCCLLDMTYYRYVHERGCSSTVQPSNHDLKRRNLKEWFSFLCTATATMFFLHRILSVSYLNQPFERKRPIFRRKSGRWVPHPWQSGSYTWPTVVLSTYFHTLIQTPTTVHTCFA